MAGGADQLIGQLADDVVEGLPVRVGDPQLGEESLQLGGSPVGVGILKGLEQSAFLLKGIGGLPGAAFLLQPHQRCLQFLGGNGLEQKIEHPHADRLPGIVELVVAGEDDDLGAGEALLDLACEGDAVAKGHLQIGDHQIGGQLLYERQRLAPVFRLADEAEAQRFPRQQLFHAGADELFVVYQKDGQRRALHNDLLSAGYGRLRRSLRGRSAPIPTQGVRIPDGGNTEGNAGAAV